MTPDEQRHASAGGPGNRPLVVGVGGSTRQGSSSQRALRTALAAVQDAGADVVLLAGSDLELPIYAPENPERTDGARRLVAALARADGVIICSPGYHGAMSGMVKNALDYAEDLRENDRPYLDGRPVACIACAAGWQAPASTLASLRSTVHALRGWPTPLGVALNSAEPIFDAEGILRDEGVAAQLRLVAEQMIDFIRARALLRAETPLPAAPPRPYLTQTAV